MLKRAPTGVDSEYSDLHFQWTFALSAGKSWEPVLHSSSCSDVPSLRAMSYLVLFVFLFFFIVQALESSPHSLWSVLIVKTAHSLCPLCFLSWIVYRLVLAEAALNLALRALSFLFSRYLCFAYSRWQNSPSPVQCTSRFPISTAETFERRGHLPRPLHLLLRIHTRIRPHRSTSELTFP